MGKVMPMAKTRSAQGSGEAEKEPQVEGSNGEAAKDGGGNSNANGSPADHVKGKESESGSVGRGADMAEERVSAGADRGRRPPVGTAGSGVRGRDEAHGELAGGNAVADG